MSYLRMIQYKMQSLAETVALALNVEVAIADKNSLRVSYKERMNSYGKDIYLQ